MIVCFVSGMVFFSDGRIVSVRNLNEVPDEGDKNDKIEIEGVEDYDLDTVEIGQRGVRLSRKPAQKTKRFS